MYEIVLIYSMDSLNSAVTTRVKKQALYPWIDSMVHMNDGGEILGRC